MSQEEIFHNSGLKRLCRICGEIIKGWNKEVSSYVDELKAAFNDIDFDVDEENVHPRILCRECYSAVLNIKKSLLLHLKVLLVGILII